jgi:hypothetical protein
LPDKLGMSIPISSLGVWRNANLNTCSYENVSEYRGSWLDWERKGGPGTKTPPKPDGKGEPKLPVQETKPVRGPGDSGEEDLGPQGAPPYPEGPMGGRQ